jgi:hypothetical protein
LDEYARSVTRDEWCGYDDHRKEAYWRSGKEFSVEARGAFDDVDDISAVP